MPSNEREPNYEQELHRIVPTAIIHRDGKYLLLHRSDHKKVYPGRWTVPGGGLEVGDYARAPKTTKDGWYYAIEKALTREIKEETGLQVKDLRYLLNMTFIRADGIPVLVPSYYCQCDSGEVVLDDDSQGFVWVTAGEAKGYDLLPGILEEIEMVERILAGQPPEQVKFPGTEKG